MLFTHAKRLPRLGVVLRSLLHQRPHLRRIHLLVRAPRRSSHCGPGWLRGRRGVVVHCGPAVSEGEQLVGALAFETLPGTLLLLCRDSKRFGQDLLRHLVVAADIFAGGAVGATGYIFGLHGGPVPLLAAGVVLYRSFLDSSLASVSFGACSGEFELALAAHLVTKGIRFHILGDGFGSRRLRRDRHPWQTRTKALWACRQHLLDIFPMLWVSRFPERQVLFVSLLEGTTEFHVGLTIVYSGLQTRKPDEVVLFAMNDNLLAQTLPLPENSSMATTELEISASLGSAMSSIRTRDGVEVTVPLATWLAGMRDRAGRVVRVRSDHGGHRSFVLTVASLKPCPDGKCSVMPTLFKAFERELDPDTALFFASAERLVNERVVAENLHCISACRPKCSVHSWCGQSATRSDGAIYDLTLRRAAGYREHTVR